MISFSFIVKWYSVMVMYRGSIIPLSDEKHVGCFHFIGMVNGDSHSWGSVCGGRVKSLEHMPSSDVAGLCAG